MINISLGRKGWLAVGLEKTPGEAVDHEKFLPYDSCDLDNNVEVINDEAAKGIREASWGSAIQQETGEGDVEIKMDVGNAPYMLIPALGDYECEMIDLKNGKKAYKHIIKRKDANPPQTATFYFYNTVEIGRFDYATFNTLELSFSDEWITVNGSILAKKPIKVEDGDNSEVKYVTDYNIDPDTITFNTSLDNSYTNPSIEKTTDEIHRLMQLQLDNLDEMDLPEPNHFVLPNNQQPTEDQKEVIYEYVDTIHGYVTEEQYHEDGNERNGYDFPISRNQGREGERLQEEMDDVGEIRVDALIRDARYYDYTLIYGHCFPDERTGSHEVDALEAIVERARNNNIEVMSTAEAWNDRRYKLSDVYPAGDLELDSSTVTLEMKVRESIVEVEGGTIDVEFYDASDDSLIGTDTVASGEVASTEWDIGYAQDGEWYVETSASEPRTSETFEFSTIGYPDIITGEATGIGERNATLHGEIMCLGDVDEAEVYFEYRKSGGSWSKTDSVMINGTEKFSQEITDLDEGSEYEYKAIIEWDSDGTSMSKSGEVETFVTEGSIAVIIPDDSEETAFGFPSISTIVVVLFFVLAVVGVVALRKEGEV